MRKILPRRILNASATGTNAYSSDITYLSRMDMVSAVIKAVRASGTFAGTLILEKSDSTEEAINAGTDTWVQVRDLTIVGTYTGWTVSNGDIALSSGSGTVKLPVSLVDLAGVRIRWTYTNATGTGTFSIEQSVKGRG